MDEKRVLEILRVISNPARFEILQKIEKLQSDAGCTCTSILDGMNISQSTFSHHLSELAQSGLVVTRPRGRCVMLTVDKEVWGEFQSGLDQSILGS